MWAKIKETFNRWGTEGIKLPFVYDPAEQRPSITALFPYVTFVMACVSVFALHFFQGLLTPTLVSIGFWVTATITYMIRKLHKLKIDLANKSIDIESEDEVTAKDSEAPATPSVVS